MDDAITSISFIGFGEAAQAFAEGLRVENPDLALAATDPRFAGPEARALRRQADAAGVAVHDDIPTAAGESDLVISMVVAKAAVDVAHAARGAGREGALYLDVNSASPATKQQAAAALAGSAFDFVDGAIMAAVPPKRHKTPIVLAGPSADGLAERLGALGFDAEAVGDEIGTASAIKMFRSIMIKGIEALMLECVDAARHYGAAERVLEAVGSGFPGIDWRERATYYAGRTATHGTRRAAEMLQVAETARGLGIEPIMAEAASRRLAWASEGGLAAPAGGGFTSLAELCDALAAVKRSQR